MLRVCFIYASLNNHCRSLVGVLEELGGGVHKHGIIRRGVFGMVLVFFIYAYQLVDWATRKTY